MTTSTFSRISGYLQNSNWEIFDNIDNKLFFFQNTDSKRILELYDDSIPGADRYFKDAITFLAEKDNKPKESFLDLFCLKQGVMQIRIPNKTGEIDIETSLNLRNTAKKIITATSHSRVEKKLVHPGTKDFATENLNECKEIPTKEGSYIVTILIPEETGILDLTQQALKTTSQLVNSESIPTSAEHTNLAEKGVSSNFLNSFEFLTNIADKEGVEISFASGTEVFECKVNKEFCSYVKELSSSFTSEEKEKIVEVEGTIKLLGWNEKDNAATIRISGSFIDTKSKLDFILQTNNYDFYLKARDAELPPKKKIRAKGTQIPGTRPSRIADISELEIIS
ncbi:hypothetical protein [Silvanigrella sp.]|jgi:uncharacterized protein YjbK|uniref:hypothetical protein n=1 Tax=Silvanigrella sp. TaxID=2024976 RepID=UPI0037C93DAC